MMHKLLGLVCLAGLVLSCKSAPDLSEARLARESVMRQVVEIKVRSIPLPEQMQAQVRDVVSMPDLQFGTVKVVLGTKTGIECGAMYVLLVCDSICSIANAIPISSYPEPAECLVE